MKFAEKQKVLKIEPITLQGPITANVNLIE